MSYSYTAIRFKENTLQYSEHQTACPTFSDGSSIHSSPLVKAILLPPQIFSSHSYGSVHYTLSRYHSTESIDLSTTMFRKLIDAEVLNASATVTPTKSMVIFTDDLRAWNGGNITVLPRERGNYVTVEDVLMELYANLRKRVSLEEMAMAPQQLRQSVDQAFQRRLQLASYSCQEAAYREASAGYRRIDFLPLRQQFSGLEAMLDGRFYFHVS